MTHKLSSEELHIYEQLCQVESAKEIARKLKNNNSYRGTIINIFRKIGKNQKQGLLLHLQVLSQTKDREYETYYRQYFIGLIKKLQSISKQEKLVQKISPEDEQKMLLLDIIQKLKKNEQKIQNLIEQHVEEKKSKQQIRESSIVQNIQVFEDILSLKSSRFESGPVEQRKNQDRQQLEVKKNVPLNDEFRKKMAILVLSFLLLILLIASLMRMYQIEFFIVLFVGGGMILLMLICAGIMREFESIYQFFSKHFHKNKNRND